MIWTPAMSTAASAPPATMSFSTAVLTCDYLEFTSSENVVTARGNAVLVSSGTRLVADELRLNMARRSAVADGHVALMEGTTRLLSDHVVYDWAASSGVLNNAYIEELPWRIWAGTLERRGPNVYRLKRAAVTSCDQNPPHYHLRARSGVYRVRERITLYNDRLALERDPVFYTPLFTHALNKENTWTFTVDPGHGARDGAFAKMMFQYPLSLNTRGRLRWDAYQRTGNGLGAEYEYGLPTVRGRMTGYYLHDRLSDVTRWNGRLAHWQALTPRLSLQANAAVQSDADVNNLYVRDDYLRVRQQAESDAALTYQTGAYSARVAVEQDQIFDPVRGRFVRRQTVLPSASLQTSPLALGASGIYLTGNAAVTNRYVRPQVAALAAEPIVTEKDLFQQTASGAIELSRRFRLTKNVTLEPAGGVSETWQSWRDVGVGITRTGLSVGRMNGRLNWRHRVSSNFDYDLTQVHTVRWRPDSISRDHSAVDGGVERNALSFYGSYRAGAAAWARFGSGYDFRAFPGGAGVAPRQRITPPFAELSLRPRRNVRVFARETVQLHPTRKPQATQLDLSWDPAERTALSSGISYNVGRPGDLDVSHGASFDLTRKWSVVGGVQYTAAGAGGLRYNRVTIREKNLVLRRDLHCWILRGEMKFRPGVNEIFFRLDLKTNAETRRRADLPDRAQFRQGREQTEE
jgi:hypothetical protein